MHNGLKRNAKVADYKVCSYFSKHFAKVIADDQRFFTAVVGEATVIRNVSSQCEHAFYFWVFIRADYGSKMRHGYGQVFCSYRVGKHAEHAFLL
jgi:hypothetical protein